MCQIHNTYKTLLRAWDVSGENQSTNQNKQKKKTKGGNNHMSRGLGAAIALHMTFILVVTGSVLATLA